MPHVRNLHENVPPLVRLKARRRWMGLTMSEKRAITREVAKRYRKARKKDKAKMLDEFVQTTGYNRNYAAWALRNWGWEIGRYLKNGDKIVLVKDPRLKKQRKKPRIYDGPVLSALKKIWEILNRPCGKRLAPFLAQIVSSLEKHGEIAIEPSVRKKLLEISAATIDRTLKDERKKWQVKGKSTTKPGTLLKSQIPVRTFSEWNENKPGFIEADLVGHDGGNIFGIYSQTLTATDIFTGWTETEAVKNKARIWVFKGIKHMRNRFPFPILGIDSDNGGEFINHNLYYYCLEEKISFTRSRSYRKNDNCYVEQKNYSVVRKMVGYARYDTPEELEILNRLYRLLSLYTNYFQPLRKLVRKERIGAKVIKKYDTPKTPCRRVMEIPEIPAGTKETLNLIYNQVNPAQLKREIEKFRERLFNLAAEKKRLRKEQNEVQKKEDFVYNLSEAPESILRIDSYTRH
jgi:hypothetical protein